MNADPDSGALEDFTDVDIAMPSDATLSLDQEGHIQDLIDSALK